ncbi:MAG: proprotein convertase P-domain-containing protein [Pirellulales bacterium]|nr:proprotein convertase P-domain-containing protein [Pirellulales bacterium]
MSAQEIASLRRLDANHDGKLETREIPRNDLPVVMRLAELADLNTKRPLPIKKLESAVAKLAKQGRDGRKGDKKDGNQNSSGVPGFGNGAGLTFLPGFGATPDEVTTADLQLAKESLKRFDRDDDGVLTEREARRLRLSGKTMRFDRNNDERLDEFEVAAALAAHRASGRKFNPENDDDDDDRRDRRRRDRDDDERRDRDRNRDGRDRRREISRLAEGIMDHYDVDGDGSLSPLECELAGHDMQLTDVNGDQAVSEDELEAWISENYPEPEEEQSSMELPQWFLDKDTNGDGQVAMFEFERKWTDDRAAEFESYDTDSDGIITRREVLVAATIKGDYRNNVALVIPAESTVVSEIEITDDFILADLNVHVWITHSRDEDLEIYLIAPSGDRIELADDVGGGDDNFDGTIFDDEASEDLEDGDPPFAGRYRPSRGRRSQLPHLESLYNRENPSNIRGRWQLQVINEDSDRPGMLHRWALTAERRGRTRNRVQP